MENTPPFYVGQRVIGLKSIGMLEKGKEYSVHGLIYCDKCAIWYVRYLFCGRRNLHDRFPCCLSPVAMNEYRAAQAKYFAPIHENFQSITLEKVLETETKLIGVN